MASSSRSPQRPAPASSPHHPLSPSKPTDHPHPSPHRSPYSTWPTSTREIDQLLSDAEALLNDDSLIDSIADLPDPTAFRGKPNPAALLAAAAGVIPPLACHNGAP